MSRDVSLLDSGYNFFESGGGSRENVAEAEAGGGGGDGGRGMRWGEGKERMVWVVCSDENYAPRNQRHKRDNLKKKKKSDLNE